MQPIAAEASVVVVPAHPVAVGVTISTPVQQQFVARNVAQHRVGIFEVMMFPVRGLFYLCTNMRVLGKMGLITLIFSLVATAGAVAVFATIFFSSWPGLELTFDSHADLRMLNAPSLETAAAITATLLAFAGVVI